MELYISIGSRIVEVVGEIIKEKEEVDYKNNKGYVKNSTVWIFTKEKSHIGDNRYPYFWKDKDDNGEVKLKFSSPDKSILDQANVSKARSKDFDTIINDTKDKEILYDEDELNSMNSAAKEFVPIIQEDDDFMKKLIKFAIIEKRMDINRIKPKVTKAYKIFNMKAALVNKTKMSVVYFMQWCEMLGLDFTMTIKDNGTDFINPLQHVYTYHSDRNKIIEEGNSEEEEQEEDNYDI